MLNLFVQSIKNGISRFFKDEEGDTNVIAIILLIVVVIGLVIIFRNNIAQLVGDIWSKIFTDATKALEDVY